MTPPKFPRRYAQRKTLANRHGHARHPPEGSAGQTRPRAGRPPSKKEERQTAVHSNKTSAPESYPRSNSLSDDESDSDSEYERDQDSGYSSSSGHDTKAEYYRRMTAQFAAEGPIMADLSPASEAMRKAEEQKWNS
jgi:hypothetical protein